MKIDFKTILGFVLGIVVSCYAFLIHYPGHWNGMVGPMAIFGSMLFVLGFIVEFTENY